MLERIVSCVYEITKAHGGDKDSSIWDKCVDKITYGAAVYNPHGGTNPWVRSAHYRTALGRFTKKPVILKLRPPVKFNSVENFDNFMRARIREMGVRNGVGTVDTVGIPGIDCEIIPAEV
jgi:hypothetical protein